MSVATTTLLSTLTVSDFTDIVRREWATNPARVTPMAKQLFQFDPIGNSRGSEKLYQEYDTQTFARFKGEGANVSKAQAGTGFSKLARLQRYGVEIDITFEERMYNQYESVRTKITDLSGFGAQRQEIDLTHRLTFSTATSYVNMDGQTVDISTGETSATALASATHALAFTSVTYNNIITGSPVFSEANLAIAELVGATQSYNNYGEKRVYNFNKLFIADYPAVRNLARQILQSDAQISAPNAEVINVYKAKYDLVVLPYLASTATGAYDSAKKNYWGLVAAGQWNCYLAEWEAENLLTPTPGNNLVDSHSDVWTYGVRIGYSIACVSARGLLISNNAS